MSLPDSECTVGGFIRSKAAADPERIVLVKDDARLSYGEAERRSGRIARGLLASGIGKGTRVAILLPNGPEWLVAWLAVTRWEDRSLNRLQGVVFSIQRIAGRINK